MEREKITFDVTDLNGKTYRDTEPATNIQITDGVVMRKKKVGTLIICDTCSQYKWECQTYPNGDTWCTKVCVAWSCRELPTGSDGAQAQ